MRKTVRQRIVFLNHLLELHSSAKMRIILLIIIVDRCFFFALLSSREQYLFKTMRMNPLSV